MLLLCWQMIDALCCELDVAHRYFEGKYEALKILQGKVEQLIVAGLTSLDSINNIYF